MTFNPDGLRLGNKVLRQRLRGPTLAAWYPKKTVSFRDLRDAIKPLGLTTFDEAEDDREEAIQMYVSHSVLAARLLLTMRQRETTREREAEKEANCCW
jgi:hypothetical protein